MSIEAMKQALDAIETYSPEYMHGLPKEHYIKALRQAIAEAEKQVFYAGNGTAGMENMTAPTGFFMQFKTGKNDQITELKKKCWDSQTERLDVEKLAKLLLEDVMSICEDLGDKGMDGHYCVDAIAKKYQMRQWS